MFPVHVYVLIGIALVLGLLGCSLVVATKRVFVIDHQNVSVNGWFNVGRMGWMGVAGL